MGKEKLIDAQKLIVRAPETNTLLKALIKENWLEQNLISYKSFALSIRHPSFNYNGTTELNFAFFFTAIFRCVC